MWNTPTPARLAKIPRLYETEEIPLKEKQVHLHFFGADCDWYIVEFDGDDTFFGFACINGDLQNAEWGYVSFSDLKDFRMDGPIIKGKKSWKKLINQLNIDCEKAKYFLVKPAKEVGFIVRACGW